MFYNPPLKYSPLFKQKYEIVASANTLTLRVYLCHSYGGYLYLYPYLYMHILYI